MSYADLIVMIGAFGIFLVGFAFLLAKIQNHFKRPKSREIA